MTKEQYQAERLDPRWQKKRLEVLERAKWECSCCGATNKTINVHHAYYVSGRKPWDYPDFALSALCKDCHKETHKDLSEPPHRYDWETFIEKAFGCEAEAGPSLDLAYELAVLRELGENDGDVARMFFQSALERREQITGEEVEWSPRYLAPWIPKKWVDRTCKTMGFGGGD